METISSKTQQQQEATPYLQGLLDRIHGGDENEFDNVYAELVKLDGKTDAVRERLERTFYSAITVQTKAILSGDDDKKQQANEVSQLAFHMGLQNKYLPARDYPAELRRRDFVSGEELKVLQVQRMHARLQSIVADPEQAYETKAEAELKMAAVERYAEVNGIAEIMNTSDKDDNDKPVGGLIARQKEKVVPFIRKAAATLTLSVITIGVSANTSHAAQKSIIDDESRDPGDLNNKKPRTFKAPIKLAMTPATEAPTLVQASPPSAVRPDGSIRLATPTVIEAPSRVEASPSPNIHTIPNVPNTPPAAPAPAIEAAPAPPIPEVIIDPKLHGETMWTERQLEQIRDNLHVYHEVQAETGVPWEVMVALHAREYGLKVENPGNGQGIYQLYSTGEYFAPGAVSPAEFKHQTILAANFLKGKAQDNRRVGGPMDFSNPDKIKDALFAYNGLASDYFKQAARLGFALGAEGSPYVMNMADDQRNSDINPNWGQILYDNGSLDRANKAPGAWPLIEGLQKINKIARDQMAAQQAAEAAAAAETARVAAEAAAAAEAARIAAEAQSDGILAGWPNSGEAAMKLFNQCDPSWGEIRTPNGTRACDVSCGPTSVAMAVNALTGRPVNPGEVIHFTNNNRMWLPGDRGTSFQGVINLGKNFGINGYQMQNFKDYNAYKQVLLDGGMILVAGSGPVPFVNAPEAHFVLIRGMTDDGRFLVADPYPKTPGTNEDPWDPNQIINSTFGAVVFTK